MRLRRAQDLEPCQGRGPLADIPGFVLGPRGEGEPDSQQLSAVFVFCPSQKSRHPRKKPWDWNHQEQPTTEADPEGILLVALSGIDFKIPLDDYVTELIVKIENFSTELETEKKIIRRRSLDGSVSRAVEISSQNHIDL